MYILALSSYLDLLALSLSHDRFEASGERYWNIERVGFVFKNLRIKTQGKINYKKMYMYIFKSRGHSWLSYVSVNNVMLWYVIAVSQLGGMYCHT